jgi:hypothetical protein
MRVVNLIPKSWLAKEHIAHVKTISRAYLEALDTSFCMSVSSVSIANFTESANFTKVMMVPDCKEWKDVCDSEMGTLERMKCWQVVDESTMPPDAELIGPKWVLKLKFENGKYVKSEFLAKMLISCLLHATGGTGNTWKEVCCANICPRCCFFSFLSAEISPMVQLRAKLCFTSEATLFGGAIDARALE